MKKTELRGIFEGTVRIREESRKNLLSQKTLNILNVVFQVILAQASAWAFVHIFTTAFGLEISELPFILTTLLISIAMLFLVRGVKIGIILLAAFLVAGGVLLFVRRSRVIAECAGLYVSVIRAFSSYYGYVSEVSLDIETSFNVTHVMTCFAFLPVWQVSYSYGKHTYPSLLTIFLLLPLFLCILGGQDPGLFPVTLMILCILAVYFTCITESINTEHEMSDRVRKRIRFILITLAGIVTAVFMAAAVYLIYPNIKNAFQNASTVYTSHFFRDLLADIPGNPFDISKTGLSEGELQRAGSVIQTGETAFSVSFEKDHPQQTYFKNFAGDTYTGSRWVAAETELPSALFPKTVTYPSIYHPNVNSNSEAYRNPLLYYQASYLNSIYHTHERDNTMFMQDRSGGGSYFYLPYGIRGLIYEGSSIASFRIYSDLYALGDHPEVTYPIYTPGPLRDVLTLVEMKEFKAGLSQPNGDPIVCYMDAEDLSALLMDYGTEMTPEEIMNSNYSEYVIKPDENTRLHYRPKETCLSAYESYVFENDLQYRETELLKNAAASLATQYGIDVHACEYEKAVTAVQNYLSTQCSFSENPGAIGSDKDFAETFLFEKREGYCVHFATAGTILLRMLGIPARYAEGFLIPACTAGSSYRVTDYDAHAWSEVFIPGYGWYPVEMTPSDQMDEPETESHSESETEPGTQPEEEKPSEGQPESGTETSEQTETSEVEAEDEEQADVTKYRENLWRLILPVLLILLLMAAVIWLLWRNLRIKPASVLQGSNGRETYLNIYNEIRRRAGWKGKHFVVDDSAEYLEGLYPEMDASVPEEVQRYAKEAYYSMNEIPEEEIRRLYVLYAQKSFETKAAKPEKERLNG